MISKKISAQLVFREYLESLLVAGLLALLLRLFVISPYKIPTSSMAPTLKSGDFVMSYKLSYGWSLPFVEKRLWPRSPGRGEVAVFRYPSHPSVSYVKRIVGLPGDRIEILAKKLVINGQMSEYEVLGEVSPTDPGHEYYLFMREKWATTTHLVMARKEDKPADFGPIVVPPGHVFVLGDNRDSSDDSRYWGTVPIANLDGRVVIIWMSLDWLERWGNERFPSIRWGRVLQSVR